MELFGSSSLSSRGLQVLLVDACQAYRSLSTVVLESCGASVTPASDGREALAAVKRQDFDFVLIDVELPVLDGFAATSGIRALDAALNKHTPIVALSSTANRERCFAAGMDAFVPKPLMRDDLIHILDLVTPAVAGLRTM